MDLEIKIRKRTPEEIAAREAEAKKRACWFCGRHCSSTYAIGDEYQGDMIKFMGRNTCGYCHGVTFGYYDQHFVDPSELKKRRYKRARYDFMKPEQNYCAWLNMLNNRLKHEIRGFELVDGDGGNAA